MFGEVVPDNAPSPNAGAQPSSDPEAMQDDDVRMDVGDRKGKEKVEDKGKEPVFFMDVPLDNLDDLKVSDNRLHCDNSSSDDDDAINMEGMDVGDSGTSSSQCPEPETGPVAEPLQSSILVHSDRSSESIPSVMTCFTMRQERLLIQMQSL